MIKWLFGNMIEYLKYRKWLREEAINAFDNGDINLGAYLSLIDPCEYR